MLGVASRASAGGCTFSCRAGAAVTGGAVTGFVLLAVTVAGGVTEGGVTEGGVTEGVVTEGAGGPPTASVAGGFAATEDAATVGHRCP